MGYETDAVTLVWGGRGGGRAAMQLGRDGEGHLWGRVCGGRRRGRFCDGFDDGGRVSVCLTGGASSPEDV